jgi:hypothetical protein
MKQLILFSFMAIAIQSQAQNVGIGTPNPLGKLTVNTESTNWNFPSILLTDDATTNAGGAILQFRNPADKRMYLQSNFGTLADGSDTYMTFSHNANYNMRIRGDGNVGIGNLNPNLAGLVIDKKVGNVHAMFGSNSSGVSIESNFPGIHFNSYYNGTRKTISTGYTSGAEMNPATGAFSIYTSPNSTTIGNTAPVLERVNISKDGVVGIPFVLELGYGQTKQIDNGKIALNNFGENNTLSLVGGGTALDGSDRRIKFFADKESDFSGPLRFTGPLKPDNNTGLVGQVLTSNGAASPTWSNQAFTNNIRFAVTIDKEIFTSEYNTNTAAITITPGVLGNLYGKITVSKTGLYRINGAFYLAASTPTPPPYPWTTRLIIKAGLIEYNLLKGESIPQTSSGGGSNLYYAVNVPFSFDIYLVASQFITIDYGLNGVFPIGTISGKSGVISGYFISE